MAKANACSGSSAFPEAVAGCLSLGKSWYFLSGCCTLQANGLSPEGDALPSCEGEKYERLVKSRTQAEAEEDKVVAYRLGGILWGDGSCDIIIQTEREIIVVCFQQAARDVRHGAGGGRVGVRA